MVLHILCRSNESWRSIYLVQLFIKCSNIWSSCVVTVIRIAANCCRHKTIYMLYPPPLWGNSPAGLSGCRLFPSFDVFFSGNSTQGDTAILPHTYCPALFPSLYPRFRKATQHKTLFRCRLRVAFLLDDSHLMILFLRNKLAFSPSKSHFMYQVVQSRPPVMTQWQSVCVGCRLTQEFADLQSLFFGFSWRFGFWTE